MISERIAYALIALLAAWQATEFSLEYRAVVGAIVAGLMGYLAPAPKTPQDDADA